MILPNIKKETKKKKNLKVDKPRAPGESEAGPCTVAGPGSWPCSHLHVYCLRPAFLPP